MFPLWSFKVISKDTDFGPSPRLILTRGSLEQAKEYMRRNHPNCRIEPQASNPVYAANAYSTNHAPGWLTRSPVWLDGSLKLLG